MKKEHDMEDRQKTNREWRRKRCSQPNMSVYIAVIAVLLMGAATQASAMSKGFTVEAGGMKVSLQLATPDGAKLVFQRAARAGHSS